MGQSSLESGSKPARGGRSSCRRFCCRGLERALTSRVSLAAAARAKLSSHGPDWRGKHGIAPRDDARRPRTSAGRETSRAAPGVVAIVDGDSMSNGQQIPRNAIPLAPRRPGLASAATTYTRRQGRPPRLRRGHVRRGQSRRPTKVAATPRRRRRRRGRVRIYVRRYRWRASTRSSASRRSRSTRRRRCSRPRSTWSPGRVGIGSKTRVASTRGRGPALVAAASPRHTRRSPRSRSSQVSIDYEGANKYKVRDPAGRPIYFIAEESGCCARQCCDPYHTMALHMTDMSGENVRAPARTGRVAAAAPRSFVAGLDHEAPLDV